MIFPYTVDKNIFDFKDEEFELWRERVHSFTSKIKKSSMRLDCREDSMSKGIMEKALSRDNVNIKGALMAFWEKNFNQKSINIYDPCVCEKIEKCDIQQCTQTIEKFFQPISFVYGNVPVNCSDSVKLVSVKDYEESMVYKNCDLQTSWEGGPISSLKDGEDRIKTAWSWLIRMSKKIPILDNLVLKAWSQDRRDYFNGLKQFCNIALSINPEIVIHVITLNKGDTDRNKYLQIKNDIENLKPIKIKFSITDKSSLFDHDRFILFDKFIGAELNRGLSTFAQFKDRFRVIYYHAREVEKYITDASHGINKNSDLSPIKNF